MFKVFYSWQAELQGNTNRHLIQEALERACKELRQDSSIAVEPVVDRDCLGLAGAPDIREAIFSKIQDADVFVADVSLVHRLNVKGDEGSPSARPTPNPNVLTELGYAMATLGTEALVLVLNTHFGSVDLLPFDIRPLRVLTYACGPDHEKAHVRKELVRDLRSAITDISRQVRDDPVHAIIVQKTRSVAGQAEAALAELIKASGLSFDPDEISEAEFMAVCGKVGPNDSAPLQIPSGGAFRQATWWEYLHYYRNRSKNFTAEVLFFTPLLRREHLALLSSVEHCSYFKQLERMQGLPTRNGDFGWLAPSIWLYVLAARRLRDYTNKAMAKRALPF